MVEPPGVESDADVVRLDRHLAMAAVDERRQLDLGRAPVVGQRIERGTDGAAREEHVVHEDDVRAVNREAYVAFLKRRVRVEVLEIVAIQRDIERAEGELPIVIRRKQREHPLGHLVTAAADADQRDGPAAIFLADHGGEALHAGGDVFCGEDLGHG